MSSPMITRMLGFCCCCAEAGALTTVAATISASNPNQMFLPMSIMNPSVLTAEMHGGRPLRVARVITSPGNDLIVSLMAFHFLHDAIQVVGLRRLQRRKLPIRPEFLHPQQLADREHVPVVQICGPYTILRTTRHVIVDPVAQQRIGQCHRPRMSFPCYSLQGPRVG